MKIYDSFGPNPRALRMFLHEKGFTLTKTDVDLMGAENRRAPYTDKNPGGQLPALELDGGPVIGETVAFFEYLEEKAKNLVAWFERVGSRPSAAASLHPMSSSIGFAG